MVGRRSGLLVAEGSLILGMQGRVGSSPDNDGTGWYCQTARARQAGQEGVRVQEPVVEPPSDQDRLQSGGYGPDSSARPGSCWLGRLPLPVQIAGGEAVVNACGVATAMLQGHSWTPTPS